MLIPLMPYLGVSLMLLTFLVCLAIYRQNGSSRDTNRLLEEFKAQFEHYKDMNSQHQQNEQQERLKLQHQLSEQMQSGLIKQLQQLQESLQTGMSHISNQLNGAMKLNTDNLAKNMDKLTQQTDLRLKDISGQVEKRLDRGFEKTTATFTDVVKRLALIDEAQKKITELSSNVVSLQSILKDKSSRGTFGEVQLSSLIRNMLPEKHFSMQHTLSNGKRADCILFLPAPTGNVVIDAKFPLENYRKLCAIDKNSVERKPVEQLFKQNIQKHIQDIASKYIISNETADGAVMFIPAEAIFADIHAYYPEIVEYAQRSRVWLVSPTTMMAIITTSRAVLKDEQTRKQVHVIQEHLGHLAKDFSRFQKRMDKLSRHIDLAHDDVSAVHTSAKKITSRFNKIERVELEQDAKVQLSEEVENAEES